jgi:iron complex outermembrane receptor protein
VLSHTWTRIAVSFAAVLVVTVAVLALVLGGELERQSEDTLRARLADESHAVGYAAAPLLTRSAPTGETEERLRLAEYRQASSRFLGGEADLDISLFQDIWLNLGLDYVNAELRSGEPLPRIPPLRGRVGVDVRRAGWGFRPEVSLAGAQDRIFPTETRTAGYVVVNVNGSYTVARQHAVHLFAVNLFNAGNRLYRNHLSFIKDLAPEIGRGVRFTYTVRMF